MSGGTTFGGDNIHYYTVTAVRQFLGGSKIACSVVTVVPMTSALLATDYYTNGISRKDNSMSSYY